MNLLKNQFWFIKDFIYQSLVFFFVLLLPTVYIGTHLNKLGNPEKYYLIEKLISDILKSDKNIFFSSFYYIIINYIGSLVYSLFPIIVNTYMINYNKFRINKEDYYVFKLLILFTANILYIIFLTFSKGDFIYYFVGVPVLITTIYYVIYKKRQK